MHTLSVPAALPCYPNWTRQPYNPAAAAAEWRRRVTERAARGRVEEPKTCYLIPAVAAAPRTAGTSERRAFMTDPSSRRETLRGHAAMLLFAVLISGSFSLGHMAAAVRDRKKGV